MLPPTKRLWNSAPRPRPSTNVKLDSARPAKKKSKVNTNLFGPVESSSKADAFPNSWVSCPRCEMVLPGPQFLPIHFAVYHRPDVATNHQSSLGFSLTDSRSQSTNFGSLTLTPVMRSNGEDVSGTLTPIPLFYQSGQNFFANSHISGSYAAKWFLFAVLFKWPNDCQECGKRQVNVLLF